MAKGPRVSSGGKLRPCRRWLALCVGAALLLCPTGAKAADDDPWFGRDKALHVGASFGIALMSYGLLSLLTPRRWQRGLGAFGLALGVGGAKEVWDATGAGDASWKDMAANSLGAASGAALGYGLDRLFFSGAEDAPPQRARRWPLLRRPILSPMRATVGICYAKGWHVRTGFQRGYRGGTVRGRRQ